MSAIQLKEVLNSLDNKRQNVLFSHMVDCQRKLYTIGVSTSEYHPLDTPVTTEQFIRFMLSYYDLFLIVAKKKEADENNEEKRIAL